MHQYGTVGGEPEAEVRNLAYSLRRELLEPAARSGGEGAAGRLLSDHGQIQVDAGDVLSVPRFRRLREMLSVPPTGTGRSANLYLRPERRASAEAYLRKTLGERALVVASADALREGLWGPGSIRSEFPGRIGDLVVVLRGARTLFYPYREGARPSGLIGGRHGGLHEKEMLIPFFCSKL